MTDFPRCQRYFQLNSSNFRCVLAEDHAGLYCKVIDEAGAVVKISSAQAVVILTTKVSRLPPTIRNYLRRRATVR